MSKTFPPATSPRRTATAEKIDFDALRATLDFRAVVEQEIGKPLSKDGRCCCPFHGGDNATAFHVFGDHAKCFACDWKGDVIDFYAARHPECGGSAGAAQALGDIPEPFRKTPGRPKAKPGETSRGKGRKTIDAALEAVESLPWGNGEGRLGKPAHLHPYPTANGRVTAYVARYERTTIVEGGTTKEKTFRPFSLHGDGWRCADPPGPWPLYNLPKVIGADIVVVVEGEKCVSLAESIGFVATSSAHGARSPARPTGRHWPASRSSSCRTAARPEKPTWRRWWPSCRHCPIRRSSGY